MITVDALYSEAEKAIRDALEAVKAYSLQGCLAKDAGYTALVVRLETALAQFRVFVLGNADPLIVEPLPWECAGTSDPAGAAQRASEALWGALYALQRVPLRNEYVVSVEEDLCKATAYFDVFIRRQ